jgi:hypothetical protein
MPVIKGILIEKYVIMEIGIKMNLNLNVTLARL